MSGQADYLDLGNWNASCAECGRKRKASTMLQVPPGVPGAGLYVCPEHWRPQQPQDFVRAVPDEPAAPWVQHPADLMIAPTGEVSLSGNVTFATSSTYTSLLAIWEGVTIPTLTLSGTGSVIINNYGIVQALVNPGPATITLRNFGVWL